MGKCLDIESFSKSCKYHLGLMKGCCSASYNALDVNILLVFIRYTMLSVANLRNEDEKTICDLYYCIMDEMENITFCYSMQLLMDSLMNTIMKYFHIAEA